MPERQQNGDLLLREGCTAGNEALDNEVTSMETPKEYGLSQKWLPVDAGKALTQSSGVPEKQLNARYRIL